MQNHTETSFPHGLFITFRRTYRTVWTHRANEIVTVESKGFSPTVKFELRLERGIISASHKVTIYIIMLQEVSQWKNICVNVLLTNYSGLNVSFLEGDAMICRIIVYPMKWVDDYTVGKKSELLQIEKENVCAFYVWPDARVQNLQEKRLKSDHTKLVSAVLK